MIKRLISSALIALCAMLGITSCSAKTSKEANQENNTKAQTSMKTEGKKLVAFFSHTGENYGVGHIKKGNTHVIADMVADASGADIFEIVPEKDYPKDSYDKCVEVAKHEKESNARPAVKGDVNVEDYDIIFLGYPNWWSDAPMCVYTFIDKHDWTGKTVIPFITHEGSGMGKSDRQIAEACKGADVMVGKGLAMQGTTAQTNQESARKSVERWLEGLGLKK